MLNLEMPNARLMDRYSDEPQSDLAGRDAYCHGTLGLGRLTKAYRDCKAGLRSDDKGLTRDEKKVVKGERKEGGMTPAYNPTLKDDYTVGDNVDNSGDTRSESDNNSSPSADSKDYGGDNTIMGMQKSVAIPVIAVSLLIVGTGAFFLFRKLAK